MAKTAKTLWYCTSCGNESPKWMGRCPACGGMEYDGRGSGGDAEKRETLVRNGTCGFEAAQAERDRLF